MKDSRHSEVLQPHEPLEFKSIEEIRERKTDLLFEYLRDIKDLNRQQKEFEIIEEIARIYREHDKKLNELLLKEGK